ncbi:hypothetical protein [Streptomyces nigrescens]|uniref:Uncharacterized protein n=1 Tax=Streptomyces nigrescens TaxID=1920 RepID=A0ABY7J0D6_STRNI|nr:hypothetical protein [Streptomyces nigrescens]WAU04023.1 hypothetical protein STRNI_002245 [Streptomyces nigrescens]
MGTHQHDPVELPGGSTDSDGRPVDQQLLGELMAAAIKGCTGCVDRLLGKVAADSVCVARLVEVSRLTALRVYRGELPSFMTDDDDGSGPSSTELRRLVRAVTAAEPLFEECEQLTVAERRSAASTALELLVGHLMVANEEGLNTAQTLSQACFGLSALMVKWWFETTPLAAGEFSDLWKEHHLARREVGLPHDGTDAVGLLLGSVLHHQAIQDGLSVEGIRDLVFTRAIPTLKDTEQVGNILRLYAAPPEIDDITVPVKRLARADAGFLAKLRQFARLTVTAHAADCPHGLRQVEHQCTLAHRAAAINGDTRAQVAAPTAEEGRRVALPYNGYSEDEPVEGAPDGYPEDHTWQINVGWILLERWDANAARWNDTISEDSTISEPNYHHETGLETLACPACGNQANFLVEGRWGDPLTLHCRCGVTVMSPQDDAPGSELGRRLLKRLILCEADPAYAARRLMPLVAEYQKQEANSRTSSWYLGPDDKDVALVEAIDLTGEDLAQALTTVLRPKLPKRHGGRKLALLLLQVAYALSTPGVKESPDGHRLESEVRDLVADLKQESDRWAPSRQPVLDRLQAWQDEGGPEAWQAAWTRTMEVAGPWFKGYRVGDGNLSDGCAALTLALYILSRESGSGVEQVGVDDVRGLMPANTTDDSAKEASEVPQRWGARLQALGHDLDAQHDPVAALWRHLRFDRPAGVLSNRREPALVAGLGRILNSVYPIRF